MVEKRFIAQSRKGRQEKAMLKIGLFGVLGERKG